MDGGAQVTKPARQRLRGARRILAGGVALAVLATLAVPSGAAATPRAFFGVAPQNPPGVSVGDIDRMGQGNVGTIRVWVNWSALDPTPAPGDTDWSTIDTIAGASARNGIEVLPFLFGTPVWVAEGLDGASCAPDCAAYAPRSPAALAAWQAFVAEAVARYGPGGSFWAGHPGEPLPIGAWQVWNEQNSHVYFKPRPSPKAYATLLDASAEAIRAQDPGADVILGGMAGLQGVRESTTAAAYLGKLYKRKGVKADFDGLAPHPYGSRVKKVREQVELVRARMKRARDKRTALWITEIGWGSDRSGNPLSRGEKGQATRLKQTFRYFKANRRKLRVKAVLWFSWIDSPSPICLWCANSGLFAPGLVEKPAWRAFTKFTGGR